MMKQFITLICLLGFGLMANTAHAQSYNQAIGARLGFPLAVSYKTFLGGGDGALEIFGSVRRNGRVFNSLGWTRFGVGGAYQIHNSLEDAIEGLYWYYGAGASVYFWSYDNDPVFDDEDDLSFGIQGYIGFDYRLEDTPLNVSIDWSPTIFINGYSDTRGFGFRFYSVAIRYIID
jgi:hypothetical protein